MIAKIRSFLLSNSPNELNHLKENVSETELKILIKECGFFEDDENEEEEDDDFDDEDYSDLDIPPSHEVYVLIVNNITDLNNHVFTEEQSEYNSNYNASDSDDDNEVSKELDFELINRISAIDM